MVFPKMAFTDTVSNDVSKSGGSGMASQLRSSLSSKN